MSAQGLELLVAHGRIERVEPDLETARIEFADAREHLRSAAKLATDDPIMAYTAVYDAARKGVDAHMRARGFKVGRGGSHHLKTFEYAVEALEGRGVDDDVAHLDEMRILRNDAEYRVCRVGDADVRVDLESVQRVIDVIEADLLA
jgi:hypothetical protein